MINQLKVGADPEFFLRSRKTGQFVSAHDLVPGTKQQPYPLKCGGALQADGTAVEFNIAPCISGKDFAERVQATLDEIRAYVPRDLEFTFQPSIDYEKTYFDSLPRESKELGCDPDFNAYSGKRNPVPDASKYPTMRTGSGHIHLGWAEGLNVEDRSHVWDCQMLVKALDAYFGRYSALWDNDKRRQVLYGAKGAFRPKKYGVEYRVLSNAWLNKPELWPWIFDSAKWVFEKTSEGYSEHSIPYCGGTPKCPLEKPKPTPKTKYYQELINGR